jgi:hypothetical protein
MAYLDEIYVKEAIMIASEKSIEEGLHQLALDDKPLPSTQDDYDILAQSLLSNLLDKLKASN